MSKQKILNLLCGIPGSGKSTWVSTQVKDGSGVWVSRDEVRFSIIKNDDEYFAKEDEVFNAFASRIQEALENVDGPDTIYIDATHLNEKGRNKILNRLDLRNVISLNAYWFDVPLQVALQRNALRSGRAKVPNSVIKRMHDTAVKPTSGEKYKYNIYTVDERGEVT